MADLLILAASLIVLCLGAEIAVRASVAIAGALRVPPLVIGLTLVAFGTDLPELIVAIRGALTTRAGTDLSGLIVGNAVGSSVCQISLVAGLVALWVTVHGFRGNWRRLAIRLLGAVLLLLLVGLDGRVVLLEGALLCGAFLAFLVATLIQRSEVPPPGKAGAATGLSPRSIAARLLQLTAGLALVVISSEFVIESALALAEKWHVRQAFVGAVLIAVGTSLPELAISVGAALRHAPGLSIGNIVGSNVFDCLVPIGVASLITEVGVDRTIILFDLPFLLFVSLLFLLLLRRGRNLRRPEGAILCAAFAVYAVVNTLLR